MTTEQKSQFKSLFLEGWNNAEVPSTELHTYLTTKAHEAGLLAPNVELTKEAARPRKAKDVVVVDFGEVDPGDEQEVVEVIQTAETLIPQDEVSGDEEELDSEVVGKSETEAVMEEVTETVKSNFNW